MNPKALETLRVNWGAALPIPKTNAEQFPEVKSSWDQGLNNLQYTFSADNLSHADKLFRGASPSNDGAELKTAIMPDGVPIETRRSAGRNSPPGWMPSYSR